MLHSLTTSHSLPIAQPHVAPPPPPSPSLAEWRAVFVSLLLAKRTISFWVHKIACKPGLVVILRALDSFQTSLPPLPLCIAVLCYAIISSLSITIRQGQSPAGWSLQTRLAKPGPAASWLGVHTGHPVGGLRLRGTCTSRRAFPTILAGDKPGDQCPCLLHRSPGLWSATLAVASTQLGIG